MSMLLLHWCSIPDTMVQKSRDLPLNQCLSVEQRGLTRRYPLRETWDAVPATRLDGPLKEGTIPFAVLIHAPPRSRSSAAV